MNKEERATALEFHKKAKGKIQIHPTQNIRNERELSVAYIPGSTAAADEIIKKSDAVFDYTGRGNRLAVVSNGSALLGLGNVGPLASMPILEGKCLLLKLMGDVNSIPVAIDATNSDDITRFCKMLAPTVGGINIEDISSPDSFDVIKNLTDSLDIPVFCDDQQGTAVIVLSAVKNSLALLDRAIGEVKIVVLGAGTAGIASTDLLLKAGARDVVVLNSEGILDQSNKSMDSIQSDLAKRTNPRGLTGDLGKAIEGADILLGLSRGGTVTQDCIKKMSDKPVVLALALPDPEITLQDAMEAGAFIYASGNIKDPNSLLNLHSFPGIVRGAFDVRARKLTDSMLIAAADALSNIVDRRHLSPSHICPRFFGSETTPRIAEAVGRAAIKEGVALRADVPEGQIYRNTWYRLFGDMEHI